MNIDENIKKFLLNNEHLLRRNDFKSLLVEARKAEIDISKLAQFLHDCGITFDELKSVPEFTINCLDTKDLQIKDITLLSVEDAEQIPEKYMIFDDWWWLRSPGDRNDYATYVNYYGAVCYDGNIVAHEDNGVRPILIFYNLKSLNLPLYSELKLNNDTKWIVISDNMLLCNDKSFGQHRFDKESNDYEKSEIKQYIHEKARELKLL